MCFDVKISSHYSKNSQRHSRQCDLYTADAIGTPSVSSLRISWQFDIISDEFDLEVHCQKLEEDLEI